MDPLLASQLLWTLLGGGAIYLVCGAVVTAAAWRDVYPAARSEYLDLARDLPPGVPKLSERKIRLHVFALGCATWPWIVVEQLAASLPPPGH